MSAVVRLAWAGDLRFEGGRDGGPRVVIDSDGVAGASPVTSLLLALAGCMAVDVVDITAKMRLPLQSLEVVLDADRRDEPPRRLLALRLHFMVSGVAAEDEAKVWRAIELSRDKYCSVWHSLKDDIDFTIRLERR